MAFLDDERGQAIQIGAVLLFAVLVIAFSLYQAFVVPNQNAEVELSHSMEVQSQLQDLRNGIHAVVGGNPGSGVSIGLGTQYPSRLVALNPPPPSGQLRTIGTTDPHVNVTIVNAIADGETGDVWNGSARRYNTGGILYVPDYNEYDSPPRTVYENSLVYNQFTDETLSLTDQSLITGDRISIVALNGSFDRSGSHTMTVDPAAISTSERTISVADGAGPITLNLTTRLSPDRWEALLSDEANVETDDVRLAPDADAVPDPFTRVLIPLNASEEYILRMTKVGVGTGTTEEPAEYLTDVSLADSTVTRGDNTTIVLEARDAYNNPNAGVSVVASADDGSISPSVSTTGVDGRVSFTYNSTEADTGSHELQFSIDSVATGFDASTGEDVAKTVDVTAPPRSGGGSAGAFSVSWIEPDDGGASLSDCTANECTWDVGASDDDTLRLNAGTLPIFEEATIDFAANNTTVGTLSPWDDSTDRSGIATTELTALESGTIGLAAAGGGGGDNITVNVQNVTGSSLRVLVEDLSNVNENRGEYLVSYEVSNPPTDFDNVGVHFVNNDDSQNTDWRNSSDSAGTVTYVDNNAGDDDYDIEVTAYDTQGDPIDTWSVSDTSDGVNPGGDDDLGDGTGPTFTSYSIEDRSNPGQQHRYRVDFQATNTNFGRVEGHLVAQNPNSGSARNTFTGTSTNNYDLSTYGYDQTNARQMKTTLLLFDSRNVVVERVVWSDGSDGGGSTSG